MVWLLLAPTKTPRELLLNGPFDFGSLRRRSPPTGTRWSTFQNGIIWTWLGNSAFYSLARARAHAAGDRIPAGYALALIEFRGRDGAPDGRRSS